MLRRDEWRWWPLAPWLAWQGYRAITGVPRLPPCTERDGREPGREPGRRLLGLGDSTIAGVGCGTHREAITGATAQLWAARTGRAVEWRAHGVSGATVAAVRRGLLADAVAWRPHAVLVSVGVNDAVRATPPAAFARELAAIVEAFARADPAVRVVYAGMPPVGSFPALRPPLTRLLQARALALAAAARETLGRRAAYFDFPAVLDPDAFAGDGFHPGPAGCAQWAEWLVERLGD